MVIEIKFPQQRAMLAQLRRTRTRNLLAEEALCKRYGKKWVLCPGQSEVHVFHRSFCVRPKWDQRENTPAVKILPTAQSCSVLHNYCPFMK